MPFLACILPVVSCICEPVMSAVRSSLETLAQRFFTFLTDWGADHVNNLVSSWRGDFEEVPVSTTAIVGAEETLAEIRAHLNDDSVGIIGIYGMGGAGKTTLLRRINNDLYKSRTARGKFDLGIWVTVSKEVNIPEIQKQIADRLNLPVSGNESQVARTLFQALSQRRFLVLLDDLWKKLDLDHVGIPAPTNRRNCKIAFTTRSSDVCTDMDANGCVRVKPLDDGRSWELFCSKVGTEVDLDNPPIQRLAKQVVLRCGGLPLYLITVGRAMANRGEPGQWELAVKDLDHYAEKLRGMDEVLSCLKFSYDYLKNDEMRSALLYCAMYPEDTEIERVELIGHWIGEGMLDDDDDVDDARNRGHGLITDLQHSCLLEAGIRDAEECVRMHDAVRDLALWLNRTSCDKVDGFMAGEDLIKGANTQRLEHVRRIWMRNFVFPPCVQNWPPNSWTLLLNKYSYGEPYVLQGIFNCMRALRVLDLTGSKVYYQLPNEIAYFQDLQYLNLSESVIWSLPKELGKLVKLRQLYLRRTNSLWWIPREAIVGLSSLQVLNMRESSYLWRAQGETPAIEVNQENQQHSSSDTSELEVSDLEGLEHSSSDTSELEVSDLEGLERLQELEIFVKSPHALQQLSRSESPRRRTRFLEVHWEYQGDDGPLRMTFTQRFDQLRHLNLLGDRAHPWVGDLRISLDLLPCLDRLYVSAFNCETTSTIVLQGANAESFRRLEVVDSRGWKALELVGKFPSLGEINVSKCDGMEELLLDEENEGTGSQQDTVQEQLNDSCFPKLVSLWVYELRDLKSIGRRPLSLPSLEYILVISCPQLKRLPLGPGSAPKLKEIWGEHEQEWWDGLEWGSSGDDPNIRNIFAPFFR